jgi:hypothetical protein
VIDFDMSDRELVSLDPKQFDALMQRLNAFRADTQQVHQALGPVDKDKSLYRALTDGLKDLTVEVTKWQSIQNDSIVVGLQLIAEALANVPPQPDLRSTHLKLVRVHDIDSGLIVEGEITKMQITDSQQATIEFGAPVDKKGFPATVQDGSVSLSVGDDSATIEQDATNPFKGLVKGVHPSDAATLITITADADLGDGVTNITGTEPLNVTGGQAAGFGPATVGTPEEQP